MRWFLLIISIFTIIVSLSTFVYQLVNIVIGSAGSAVKQYLIISGLAVVISLALYIVRKAIFPIPGIDYK